MKKIERVKKELEREFDKYKSKIKCKICEKVVNKNSYASKQLYCNDCKIKAKRFRAKGYNNQLYLRELFKSGNKLIKEIKCKNCGKIFYGYETKNRRFCNNKCQYRYALKNFIPKNKGDNVIFIKCKTCGSRVKTYKGTGTKFCSRLCYEIDHKENWEFPHKGKPIVEWIFNNDQIKYERHRKKMSERILKWYKEHPEFIKRVKGKTFIQIYGEQRAKEIKDKIRKRNLKEWENPKNRKKWLKTNGRFQKGEKPWNTGKKHNYGSKVSKTKEKKFLDKLGIKHHGS